MFQTPQYQQLFAKHSLADFEAIWQREIAWFEEPNVRRGGWSGVGTISLQANNGQVLRLFVKKQENHGRKSLRHPIVGEPTFRRESQNLRFLAARAIGVPQLVYYAESGPRAILITEALNDFVPLDNLEQQWRENASRLQQQALLTAVAKALRRFHQLGMMHRALYPKHIFVQNVSNNPQVALIDLEKARFSSLSVYRTFFDLAALNRHAYGWRKTQRMRFLLSYWGVSKLSRIQKLVCRMLLARSAR